MLGEHILKSKNRFFNFFPPPRFLTMQAFGLNVSDHSIKIIGLDNTKNIKIKEYGEEMIPDGVIKSGSIINKDGLIEVLKNIKKKYKMTFVRVSLPEEKAYVFKIKVPNTPNEKDIKNSIEFQLEDNVPISVNEAVFDYSIIPGTETGGKIEVGVSVIPQKIVASFLGILKEVGFVPVSFEIEAESIARAIIKDGNMGTYMIVDYGRTRTGFSVISRGVVRYTSTAEIGGDPITKIVEESGFSKKEAIKIKNEDGLLNKDKNSELHMSLANTVSVLKDEINKRYIFWHTHKDKSGNTGEKIEKIFLVGGNSNLAGLEDYLSTSLKVKVERANVWSNINFEEEDIPPINFGDSLSYASAIGLALREFF